MPQAYSATEIQFCRDYMLANWDKATVTLAGDFSIPAAGASPRDQQTMIELLRFNLGATNPRYEDGVLRFGFGTGTTDRYKANALTSLKQYAPQEIADSFNSISTAVRKSAEDNMAMKASMNAGDNMFGNASTSPGIKFVRER